MDEAAVYSGLTEVFRDALEDDTLVLTPDLTAEDVPGWDSLKMVMIIVAVQERFGIKLRSSEVDKLSCVGDLARLVEAKAP